MSNPLTEVLPSKVRKYVYALYTLAVVAAGVWAIFGHVPDEVAAVLTAVGGAIGATAASNVKPHADAPLAAVEPTPDEQADGKLRGTT